MNKNVLLAEVEDTLRTMPPRDLYGSGQDVVFAWIGRAAATITRWNIVHSISASAAARDAQSFDNTYRASTGFDALRALLHQARADLQMEVGQTSVVIPQGRVFDYFDELRKVVETARADVFFVDPYLDGDFVSRYLPSVASGAAIRLLTSKKLSLLLPAVKMFSQQANRVVEVRSSTALHDRFLFVDRKDCYLSARRSKTERGTHRPRSRRSRTDLARCGRPMRQCGTVPRWRLECPPWRSLLLRDGEARH